MSSRGRVSFVVPGLVLLVGGFVIYLVGQALYVAAGISLMVLGLIMVIQGLKMVPRIFRYVTLLIVGLYLVVQGGNLLWSMGLASSPQAQQSYSLPFMAIAMPWYIAGDLGIFFITAGAVLLFYAGIGFGLMGRRMQP